MAQSNAAGSLNSVAIELAKSTGVAEGDVAKILDRLGLPDVARLSERGLPTTPLTAKDLRISARIGRMLIAV